MALVQCVFFSLRKEGRSGICLIVSHSIHSEVIFCNDLERGHKRYRRDDHSTYALNFEVIGLICKILYMYVLV